MRLKRELTWLFDLLAVFWYFFAQDGKLTSVFGSISAHIRNMCTYCTVKVSLMRAVCKFVCFRVNIGARERDFRSDEVTFPSLHLYGFTAVYPHTQCGSGCLLLHLLSCVCVRVCVCVCVCVCFGLVCPGLFHMCLTLL